MDQMNYDSQGNYMGPMGGYSDAGRMRRSGRELKINGKRYREIKETVKECMYDLYRSF